MNYKHKWVNDGYNFFAFDENGAGFEWNEKPQVGSIEWKGDKSRFVGAFSGVKWRESLQQRYTDQQMELEGRDDGWVLIDKDEKVSFGGSKEVEVKTANGLVFSLNWYELYSDRAINDDNRPVAWRLSNADGYTQGVKNINCECGKHMHMTGGNHLTNCPLNTESYIDPVKPEWKAGELPPKGTICNIKWLGNECIAAEITYMGSSAFCFYSDEASSEIGIPISSATFNPYQSERDKVIAKALKEFEEAACTQVYDMKAGFVHLYDLGMLKAKESS